MTDVRQGTLNTQRMAVVVSTSVSILFSFILGQFFCLEMLGYIAEAMNVWTSACFSVFTCLLLSK